MKHCYELLVKCFTANHTDFTASLIDPLAASLPYCPIFAVSLVFTGRFALLQDPIVYAHKETPPPTPPRSPSSSSSFIPFLPT